MLPELPTWMYWTAAISIVVAGGVLLGGLVSNRRREYEVSAFTVEPLPRAGSSNSAKPRFAAPAPVAATVPTGSAEQRSNFRRPGNPIVVMIADGDERRIRWNAWVVDRSRHGLRIAIEQPLVVGEKYAIRPSSASATTPWSTVEARHCTPVDKHWEAGCQFLEPPPIAVFMQFG